MNRFAGSLIVALVALAFAGTLGCGGSPQQVPHQLDSVTVAPATADARNYPKGQVQFTAAGNFNSAPYQVNPLPGVNWTASYPSFQNPATTQPLPTDEVLVSASGMAQCAPGAVGTFSVLAWLPATLEPGQVYNCPAFASQWESVFGNNSCIVYGTATLVCP